MLTIPEQSKVARNIDADESGDVHFVGRCAISSIYAANLGTGEVFLKVYDKATAPDQTDTPVFTIPIEAAGPTSIQFPAPVRMNSGIGVRATTGVADLDIGAPALNAVVCNIAYVEIPAT